VNPYEGVQEFKNKLALDYELFNGFAYEVHYNKLGQLAALYHVDFSKVRTLDHDLYMYAEDWKKAKHEDMKHYRPFNPKKAQPMEVQLFYFREYAPGLGVYPLPPYQHCLQYIEIDVEIANFHNNNIRNGFSNGTLVQLFKGQPSQEIAYEFERKFKAKTTGTDNAGGVLIQFNEMNEKEATINHLQPSDMDDQFIQLNETVQDEIFVGHNFPKILLGYATEGALGQRNEMIQAYELLHKSYINRRQEKIETCLENTLEVVYPGIQISTKDSEFLGLDFVALYQANIATLEETRNALGLPTRPEPQAVTFSSQVKCDCEMWKDSDIEVFSKFGVSADEFEDVPMLFALDTKEKKVLAVVTADEKATVKNIADAVKLDEPEVIEILKKLQSDGKLNWTNNAIKITDIGRADIQDEGLPKIEVRYKYDLSPDAPPLMPGGKSREFCIKMMDLKKLYTRAEIDQISGIVGYNAWLRRGGWYTVPNSEPPLHIPHCRHEWAQRVVRRKS
jgi:DNA-binding Lrp family transcriptional regulator